VEQVEAKLKKKSGWMLRCAILTNNFEPSSQCCPLVNTQASILEI
jgi:hypothetical protein